MRAFFVCVVRRKLLLENEFPTQVMLMHPGLSGATFAHFLVLLHTFLFTVAYVFFTVA